MNQNYRAGINPVTPVYNGDDDPLSYGYARPSPKLCSFLTPTAAFANASITGWY